MNDYNKITALYSRLSVGDEDRDGGESNSIQNQKKFLESYARQLKLTNIRHYIDDDESGRFFDRSAYSRMIEDVENGKIGVCIMKDMTRWGRDYLQVGNAMELLSEVLHTVLLSFENGSSLSWMVGILFSFYPCIFPPFGKLKASKDRIYDANVVGLGNGIPNKLPMLKNLFL